MDGMRRALRVSALSGVVRQEFESRLKDLEEMSRPG
jgi:hypothetical protein